MAFEEASMNLTNGVETPSVYSLPVWQKVLLVSILVIIGLTGILGNGIVLIYNCCFKKKHTIKPLEVFVLNSALADFIASMIYVPLWVYGIVTESWELGAFACTLHNTILPQALSISQLTNMVIAIYCCIKCVIDPNKAFKTRTTLLISGFIWVLVCVTHLSIFFSGVVTSVFDRKKVLACKAAGDPNFNRTLLPVCVLLIYIPLLTATALYVTIFIKIKFKLNLQTNNTKNHRGAKAMAGMLFMFLVLYIPMILVKFTPEAKKIGWLVRLVHVMVFSTFALNPIYYMSRVRTIVPPWLLRILSKKIKPATRNLMVGNNDVEPRY